MSELTERFHAAVLSLVTDGSVKPRLVQAYSCHLSDIDQDALPDELRAKFVELRELLHQHRPVCGESPIEASVRKMSARDADACAAVIVGLLTGLMRNSAVPERFKVVAGAQDVADASAHPPPAFLAERR